MTVFNTTVLSIGPEAELFKDEKMIILFGKDAPESLADYCYNIEVGPINGEIREEQKLTIGDHHFKITSVGNVVTSNLKELGHITIKFDGSSSPELPGTLYVEDKTIPEIGEGTIISIS